MKLNITIKNGIAYLLSCFENDLCPEFHQLRHGPSLAWTTACTSSSLAEFNLAPQKSLDALLSLQWDCGGWSYNQNSTPDADTTLRVLQFLAKINFKDRSIIEPAEKFIIKHQQKDGGIATYLPEAIESMGYIGSAWTTSHPCVTALATNVLTNSKARKSTSDFINQRLKMGDARAYWWSTPWYVRYEAGEINGEEVGSDTVEISLALLLKTKLGLADNKLADHLRSLQLADGSFPKSKLFRIPRPLQFMDNINETVEGIEDLKRTFATSSAIVALFRHEALT